jgi:hypothetical protein
LHGGGVKNLARVASKVFDYAGKIPGVSTNVEFMAVQIATEMTFAVAKTFFDDRDALYTVRANSIVNSTANVFDNWEKSTCNANVRNSVPMDQYMTPFLQSKYPQSVKYVQLKYLIPTFGTN